jgi:hypothetical protein
VAENRLAVEVLDERHKLLLAKPLRLASFYQELSQRLHRGARLRPTVAFASLSASTTRLGVRSTIFINVIIRFDVSILAARLTERSWRFPVLAPVRALNGAYSRKTSAIAKAPQAREAQLSSEGFGARDSWGRRPSLGSAAGKGLFSGCPIEDIIGRALRVGGGGDHHALFASQFGQ